MINRVYKQYIIVGMETISLNTARKIIRAIETYNGAMDAQSFMSAIAEKTLETPETIARVIEFVSEIKGTQSLTIAQSPPPAQAPPPALPIIDDGESLNLMDELTYNYRIAKMVLQSSLQGDKTINAEETRKSLRTISNFMEQALKLQERLYNTQQMQKFQDAVLDTIATVDPVYRDTILDRLLNVQ